MFFNPLNEACVCCRVFNCFELKRTMQICLGCGLKHILCCATHDSAALLLSLHLHLRVVVVLALVYKHRRKPKSSKGCVKFISMIEKKLRAVNGTIPLLGHAALAIGGVLLLGLLSYGLQIFFAPCFGFVKCLIGTMTLLGCCFRRSPYHEVGSKLPPTTPPVTTVKWHGPGTGMETSTTYYQASVRGRGSSRKPNDLLVRAAGKVARVQLSQQGKHRVDRHGLTVELGSVLGCSDRKFRRELESSGRLHLCRQEKCPVKGSLHLQEYAAIDSEAIVDIGVYARLTPCRVCVLGCRMLKGVCKLVLYLLRPLCCCCRRGRGNRQVVTPDGDIRELDPDSESEPEVEERPCQAVRVGLQLGKEMRALRPNGCCDTAGPEDTTLLDDDAAVSDVPIVGPG